MNNVWFAIHAVDAEGCGVISPASAELPAQRYTRLRVENEAYFGGSYVIIRQTSNYDKDVAQMRYPDLNRHVEATNRP